MIAASVVVHAPEFSGAHAAASEDVAGSSPKGLQARPSELLVAMDPLSEFLDVTSRPSGLRGGSASCEETEMIGAVFRDDHRAGSRGAAQTYERELSRTAECRCPNEDE